MRSLRAALARAVEEAHLDPSELQRDWLYNNSLTAFLGALLILLAWHIHITDEGDAGGVEPSSVQWVGSISDWVAPYLSPLHLPLSAVLFVVAFTLLAASTWRKTPVWAAQVGVLISFLTPLFVWVGLFTAWLPIVGDLFTSDPNVGVVVFYVGFLFLVLISMRPLVVKRLNRPSNVSGTRENGKSNRAENRLWNWSWEAVGLTLQNAVMSIPRYVPGPGNFWVSLLGLASFATVIWIFGPIEDHNARVIVTLIYAVMPILFFWDSFTAKRELGKLDLPNTWLTILSVSALLIVLFDRAGFPAAVISVASILVSIPLLWVFWMIARGRWLLLFAIVPSMFAATLYLVRPITPAGVVLDYLFVPLPVLSLACVAWALPTRWFLNRAERSRGRPINGPAMESVSMLFLFTPLVVLTMLTVNALGFGETWVGVSGVVMALIFSSTISEPVRQFVLDLGNLSPDRNCPTGGNRT